MYMRMAEVRMRRRLGLIFASRKVCMSELSVRGSGSFCSSTSTYLDFCTASAQPPQATILLRNITFVRRTSRATHHLRGTRSPCTRHMRTSRPSFLLRFPSCALCCDMADSKSLNGQGVCSPRILRRARRRARRLTDNPDDGDDRTKKTQLPTASFPRVIQHLPNTSYLTPKRREEPKTRKRVILYLFSVIYFLFCLSLPISDFFCLSVLPSRGHSPAFVPLR